MNIPILGQTPAEIVLIEDDAVAKAFLLHHEMLDKIPHPSTLSVNCVYCVSYKNDTHWIAGVRFHGFEDERENGYGVCCWPKSSVSKEEALQQLEEFTDGSGRPKKRVSYGDEN